MRALKTEKAMLAFTFFTTDGGDSFDYLEKDVNQEGGSVERVSNELVIIKIGGAEYALPLGFAVIISGGVGKIVSQEVFDNEYVCIVDEDKVGGSTLNSIIERLAAIEEDIAKLKANARSNTKSRKENNNA